MFKNAQSLITQIRDNKDYQCVSLRPDTAARALKAARKTGQRVCVVAKSFGRKHIIFVAKDFQTDAWVEGFFRFAKEMSEEMAEADEDAFCLVSPCEYVAAVARLSAAVNGYIYCRDDVLSCGSYSLLFYKD